ncbi:MAG TPA: polysaccharide pyruvyl transferase family protein [Herpetosiphonaceae bacterium]
MKIIVLNAHSPKNAGDLAILEQTMAVLRRAFPAAALTITVNDELSDLLPAGASYVGSLMRWVLRVDAQGEWHWRKPLVPFYALWLVHAALMYRVAGLRPLPRLPDRRGLMRAYYDADLVVVIGGGHLYARHAANIAFAWLWLGIALAVLMGKPLLLLPQSFGPLPGTIQRAMLRWLLSHSALTAAREYRSLQLLAEIGLRRRVLLLPDLAFAADATPLNRMDTDMPELIRSSEGKPLVGLTLMDWQRQNPQFGNQHGYEQAILALMRHLRQHYDARVVLFAQCTGPNAAHDDRLIARRLVAAAQAQGIDGVALIDAVLSPEQLKAAYARLDLLVATRMHSAIFALSGYVPALAIGYLYKSVGIMELLGLERYALDIDTLTAERLCAAFDALWAERERVRERLVRRIPAIQKTLERLPELIRRSVREA